jgi:hypothetical protein
MNRLILHGSWLLAVAVAAFLAGAPDAAADVFQTTLDTLVPGGGNAGGVTLDDARFSGFTFESADPVVVRAEDVTVRISTEPGYWGVAHVGFAYTPALPAAAGPASTVGVGYNIELGPSFGTINRAGLRFNGPVPSQGPGNAAATVTQTLTNPRGTDLAPGAPVRPTESLAVFHDGPGRLPDSNSEFLDLLPVITSLEVRNDVSLTPRAGTAEETAVWFVNTYLTVPEPAAAGLLPLAAAALLRRHCRAA